MSTWILKNQKSKTTNRLNFRYIKVLGNAVLGVCCQSQEVGAVASVYLNEFQIIWDHKTRYLFSLFISFRWGKIYSGGRMEGVEIGGEE